MKRYKVTLVSQDKGVYHLYADSLDELREMLKGLVHSKTVKVFNQDDETIMDLEV